MVMGLDIIFIYSLRGTTENLNFFFFWSNLIMSNDHYLLEMIINT